ncbi:MAG: adenine phosphoribosyltransferase [Desulfovibrio sp.]|nr:adenine phosphoribosyltransferase [Desulfovibrio sp.]MCA1985923.1 adenine phosphoribosyltransferase [Desulfovibrio sp.]
MNLREYIRDIPDFPKQGILFFDITPLMADPKAFRHTIDTMAERFRNAGATKIMAAEARGFIFGAPLAYAMGIGFVPVRKPGKLPYKTRSVTYSLEYGMDTLSMHEDAVAPGEKVLLIDDLLATGGTAGGLVQLAREAKAEVVGMGFLVELSFLEGPGKMQSIGMNYDALLSL